MEPVLEARQRRADCAGGEVNNGRKFPDVEAGAVFGDWTLLEGSHGKPRRAHVSLKARCACGREDRVLFQSLMRGKSRRCVACVNRSRGKARTERTERRDAALVGTRAGHFEILAYLGRPAPKRAFPLYRVRDVRCGHESEIYVYGTRTFNGYRALCGCPVRYPGPNGYIFWGWHCGGRKINIFEHRIVMEREKGRELLPDETVHHINGVRDDNRPENLQLRQGRHGKGVVYCCRDCGSENVAPVELAEVA
jgi:HNH endonuclease